MNHSFSFGPLIHRLHFTEPTSGARRVTLQTPVANTQAAGGVRTQRHTLGTGLRIRKEQISHERQLRFLFLRWLNGS